MSRISLGNILFATDFSDVSKAALPFALVLAHRHGGKIFVTRILRALGIASDVVATAPCPVLTVRQE